LARHAIGQRELFMHMSEKDGPLLTSGSSWVSVARSSSSDVLGAGVPSSDTLKDKKPPLANSKCHRMLAWSDDLIS
jgi:hypothetical protein